MTIVIPKNTGFYVEVGGNITGGFDRANDDLTCIVEREHGSYYIVRLPKGGRAMVIQSLVLRQ